MSSKDIIPTEDTKIESPLEGELETASGPEETSIENLPGSNETFDSRVFEELQNQISTQKIEAAQNTKEKDSSETQEEITSEQAPVEKMKRRRGTKNLDTSEKARLELVKKIEASLNKGDQERAVKDNVLKELELRVQLKEIGESNPDERELLELELQIIETERDLQQVNSGQAVPDNSALSNVVEYNEKIEAAKESTENHIAELNNSLVWTRRIWAIPMRVMYLSYAAGTRIFSPKDQPRSWREVDFDKSPAVEEAQSLLNQEVIKLELIREEQKNASEATEKAVAEGGRRLLTKDILAKRLQNLRREVGYKRSLLNDKNYGTRPRGEREHWKPADRIIGQIFEKVRSKAVQSMASGVAVHLNKAIVENKPIYSEERVRELVTQNAERVLAQLIYPELSTYQMRRINRGPMESTDHWFYATKPTPEGVVRGVEEVLHRIAIEERKLNFISEMEVVIEATVQEVERRIAIHAPNAKREVGTVAEYPATN